jgi:hypothetical protein
VERAFVVPGDSRNGAFQFVRRLALFLGAFLVWVRLTLMIYGVKTGSCTQGHPERPGDITRYSLFHV